MQSNFSPSINIVRDFDKDIEYISTPNAERVIDNLNTNVKTGTKSFYLIGSYGTGKSSFILALEKQLLGSKKFFNTKINFNGKIHYKPLNIVGDYRSLDDALRETLNINSKKDLIFELNRNYLREASGGNGLILAIDEFGKFLEYAAQHTPEKELYLLQKLAEYSNDSKNNVILLTALHQNIDAYELGLNSKQKNEWDKVKGRYKEVTFNEPVEQLLYLAAKKIKGQNEFKDKNFSSLYKTIVGSKVYPLKNILSEELAKQLFPMDILASGILASALKKYGQNERSLFTFLHSTDLKNKIKGPTNYFSLADVYDYLATNYYSFLFSKSNEDFFKWSITKNSLDRVEIFFEKDFLKSAQLIKVIGMLNIFAPKGAKLNKELLYNYGKYALKIEEPAKYLKELQKAKIVKHQAFSDSFVLFEGTDLDIELAVKEAESQITISNNVAQNLKQHFNFSFKPVKAAYIEKGTPRFFEYIISEDPIKVKPEGETDGFINLIFNENLSISEILKTTKEVNEPIVYILYTNTKIIKKCLTEIEKINFVLQKNVEDRVAYRELKILKDNTIATLNSLVLDGIFHSTSAKWVYNGSEKFISNTKEFNKLLSFICNSEYSKTPIFLNELVNRDKLPAAITIARQNLVEHLYENWHLEDIGYPNNSYPPDKTIYLSLLKATGIHREAENIWTFAKPSEKSFKYLWETSENWLNKCKANKKCLAELIEILSTKPLKLKRGFIDFWVIIFLFIKREDYALYEDDIFQSSLNKDLIDSIIRYPEKIFIKAFNVQGVKLNLFHKYRSLINKSAEDEVSVQTFIETVKPFLTFYRKLPEYTKRTSRLSVTALKLREAISNAKDPEKMFFEDFPQALGYSSAKLYSSTDYLEDYVMQLQNNIRELRTCSEELVNRVEKYLLEVTALSNKNFPEYKNEITIRFQTIKHQLLLPYQRVFYFRLVSELNDRSSWINSIIHALINKNLDGINDDEEEIIYKKLSNIIIELDNLCEFSNLEIDHSIEDAIKIELTPIHRPVRKEIVRVPKKQIENIKNLEILVRNELDKTKDKKLKKYLLLKLLNEELNDN